MKEKREFNFAERWVDIISRETEKSTRLKTRTVIWGLSGLLLLGVVGSTPWLWEKKVGRDIALVEGKISSLGDIANQVSQLKALKAKAAGQQQLLDSIKNSSRDPAPILDKLKNTLPADSVLNSFSWQENAVTLSISVPKPVDVARLWVSLRDSGMFQGVDIQTVSLQDNVQTLNFNLTLK